MEITYDETSDSLYIELSKKTFAKNKKVDDLTIFDLDSKGNIIGIELLDASKRIPKESLMKVTVKKVSSA